MNTISKLAIVVVLVGTVVLFGPSFGFSTIASDRGVAVSTADGTGAYLGVDSQDDIGELRGDDSPERVATLYNNLDEDVEVIEFEIYNDDDTLAIDSPDIGSTIESGTSEDVTITCTTSDSIGEREIEIEVVEVDGKTTTINGVSFNVTVDIQCNKGGGSGTVNFESHDVSTDDTSQTFSFDRTNLQNRHEVYIDLSDPQTGNGVDYTDGEPTVVNGGGTASYDTETNRIIYDPSGGNEELAEIRIDDINVVGDSGDRYAVTYTEDRHNDENRDDSDIFYITD